MTPSLQRHITFGDHTSRWPFSDEWRHSHFVGAPLPLDKEEVPKAGDITYTSADILRDQLGQLPDGAERLILVQLLRTSELREVLDGLITDVIAACQAESLPAVAEAVNGWVATAEETVASRRKLRHIIAARESMRKQNEDAD